jgi:hypothetical protein
LPCIVKGVAVDEKHAVVAGAGLSPDERDTRKRPLDAAAIVADLYHEQSAWPQMLGRAR